MRLIPLMRFTVTSTLKQQKTTTKMVATTNAHKPLTLRNGNPNLEKAKRFKTTAFLFFSF